jgi:ubiquinone biosynthesis protein
VFISSEFAAPVFALLTIEEQVREWAPDLDFQVVAQSIIIASIALIAPVSEEGDMLQLNR